jgi:hypothetical protein
LDWNVDIRSGVDVLGDFVTGISHSNFSKQVLLAILASQVSFGVGVKIEGLITSSDKFPISNDLLPEKRVQGFDKALPIVATLNLPPHVSQSRGSSRASFV